SHSPYLLWLTRLPPATAPLSLHDALPILGHHRVDDRLVGWQDVMPTLLDLAGVPIPPSVEGLSMVGEQRRAYFYGEIDEGAMARSEEHTSELQSRENLVCRLLLEKKKRVR